MRQLFWISLCEILLLAGSSSALGDSATNGPNGIDIPSGAFTGDGIGIGQVEVDRPGLPGFDSAANVNDSVVPAAVFRQDGPANAMDVLSHAEEVAGVLISTDATLAGVAPDASLYASAYVTAGTNPGYQDALISIQHVSQQPNVWAVNNSWFKENTEATLDGNTLLTLGVDWIANHYNNLEVFAGVETGHTTMTIPTDNYNGMTIAYSERVGAVWRQVGSSNIFNEQPNGGRTLISLIAPGDGYPMTDIGNMTATGEVGTSFAVPQVTGSVALLQQFAEVNINNNPQRWDFNARQHQVIKAVLMNSADKLIDNGTVMVNGNPVPQGGLLGMTRTVIDQQGDDWLSSEAYGDGAGEGGRSIPLDDQMGAGHLNVTRAVQQFSPGKYDANSGDVPPIGWDFGHTTGANNRNVYPITGSLSADHFISLTLAWDRHVEFSNDANGNDHYDRGDTFQPSTSTDPEFDSDDLINNLALYLLPKGSFVIQDAIAASFAGGGTIQHIFFQIPETGEYEIWVQQTDPDVAGRQDYGLAWWASPANLIFVPGDYNGDQVVDAQDYTVWRSGFGDTIAPGTGADGNGDGVVNSADYVLWRKALNAGSGSSLASVPEPSAIAIGLIGLSLCGLRRRSQLYVVRTKKSRSTPAI